MSMLLDTSVVIDCLRKFPAAMSYFERLPQKPSISVVTVAEIAAGVRNRRDELDAQIFFDLTKALPLSREIAEHAGSLARHFGKSHAVELADAMIAATAEHHALKLATLNLKHFPMFPKLKRPY